jgi:MFS family permease
VQSSPLTGSQAAFLGLSGYQWLVIAAGWAGWGLDVYDAVLFNFVARSCIPVLLHLPADSPAAKSAAVFWNGAITSTLLVCWALGGIACGRVADRIGRKRALFLTIAIYALGTGACAFVTNIGQLILCRAVAALGIGGEWAIGASLVAEVVPENRRVEAGVIMQTGSPLGVILAGLVNYQITGVWLAGQPQTAWRYVFLAGLLPVVLAVCVRLFLRESERWEASREEARTSSPRELFAPGLRRATWGGLFVAAVAILGWWGCNAFVPLLGSSLAAETAKGMGLGASQAQALTAAWQAHASTSFNFGGLIGTFAAWPLARVFGRRPMFIVYFLYSALALFATFGLAVEPYTRLSLLSLVGAGVYGIFGAFTFYLPELFPVRLRATGAGFCYNTGRVLAAFGPLAVGSVSAAAGGSSTALIQVLFWLGVVPLGAAFIAWFVVVETRGRPLLLCRVRASGAEARGQVVAIRDAEVRRRELAGPGRCAPVHPGAAAAGGARRGDVEPRVVADIEDVARGEAEVTCQSLEAAAIGFAGADLARIERYCERRPKPDAAQVRIAVAQRGERKGALEAREPRSHVREDIHLAARREEHLEGARRDVLVVAALARVAPEGRETQVSDVVGVVRLGARQLRARLAHILERYLPGNARTVFLEPLQQPRFGPGQHRLHIPECIIEIKSDGAHVVQHASKVTT